MKGEEKIRVRFKESNYGSGPNFYNGKEYEGHINEDGSWRLINAKGDDHHIWRGAQHEFDVLDEIPTGTYIWRCTARCNKEDCHLIVTNRVADYEPYAPRGCPWGAREEWKLIEE